jgi:predicted RNA-binding Zn-ribbon protein involved in translation (DUF1610 family)
MLKKRLTIGLEDETRDETTTSSECPPQIPVHIYDVGEARTLLEALSRDPTLLTPRLGIYVTYPKAEAAIHRNSEIVSSIIAGLWSEGYLNRSLVTVVYKCPHDGTISLRPRRLCPKCKSEDLEKVAMIEHLGHSHVDTEQHFLKNGQYVCPICGKTLKLIGVDYRRASSAYHCLSCGNLTPEPLRLWACNHSQHSFTEDEAVIERVYNYTQNPEKEEPIEKPEEAEKEDSVDVFTRIEGFLSGGGGRHDLIDPLTDIFKKHNYAVKVLNPVKGTSGTLHMVDLHASRPQGNVLLWTFDGEEFEADDITKLASIKSDLNATRIMIVAVPPMKKKIETLAKKADITVIDGKNIDEIVEKVELLIEISDL